MLPVNLNLVDSMSMKRDQRPLPRCESRSWHDALINLPCSEQPRIDSVLEVLKDLICEEIHGSFRVWDGLENRTFTVDTVEKVMMVIFFSVGDDERVEFVSWEMSVPKAA